LKNVRVPVQKTSERTVGFPTSVLRPSRISRKILPCSSVAEPSSWFFLNSGVRSALRILARNAADSKKERASNRMARGAVKTCTSPPASPGPTISAAERLISSLLLPSTSSPRRTSEGR